MLFNAINGFIYGTVTYTMTNYQAFVNGDRFSSAIGYIGITMLMNIMANVSSRSASML